MGRYPLKTKIGEYMNATDDFYSPTTQVVRKTILYAVERDYARLHKTKPDLKPDPKDWKEPEIVSLIASMRERGLSHATQAKYLGVVNGLLKYLGNSVLDSMKKTNPQVFPMVDTERKGSLKEDDLAKVLRATESRGDWTGECRRFVFGMYAYTGLRASELIKAIRHDLDTTSWTIRVSHPKGERSYGKPRIVPIPEPLRPIVQRFLNKRETYLAKMGMLETEPLVFPKGKPNEFLNYGSLNNWKIALRKLSGVMFTVHSLRRTYGQNLLNRGVPIETVSLMLGHNSTLTTEKHYCRKDVDSARLEVLRAFEKSTMPNLNSPKLTPSDDYTGYA